MTTNQILAVSFPLLVAAAFWTMAIVMRKPWAKRQPKVLTDNQTFDTGMRVAAPEIADALGQADRLIQQARKRILSHSA